jgi:hypothetical protein
VAGQIPRDRTTVVGELVLAGHLLGLTNALSTGAADAYQNLTNTLTRQPLHTAYLVKAMT